MALYALFSDVHADREGLDLLKRHPQFLKADKRICLGDSFNAHAHTDAMSYFDEIMSITDNFLLGNHEGVLIGESNVTDFNPKMRKQIIAAQQYFAYQHTEFIERLRQLPKSLVIDEVHMTHASFDPANQWKHVRYIEDVQDQERLLPGNVCITAHGHIPFIAWKDKYWFYQRQIYGEQFILDSDKTWFINTGSVLGSREMRWLERSFLTYDSELRRVAFFNLKGSAR